MDLLRVVFSYVCGQEHCWVLGGITLPLCQRCTGLYVGACFGLLVVLLFRPRPSALLYWMHGLFMLAMIPFGFHLVQHGGLARTFTGALFAFGLVYYLALNSFSVRDAWRDVRGEGLAAYFCTLGSGVVLLLVLVYAGGAITSMLLSGFAVAGLASLLFLALSNLILLPGILRILLRRSIPS